MKHLFYVLGMVLAMCCCSTKGVNTTSNSSESKNEPDVNYLYKVYDLTTDNLDFDLYGFSGNESFGRWTYGDTAILDLKAAPMSEFTAKLDISMIGVAGEPLEFDINVNGDVISHVSTNGGEPVYVNVPKERVGMDGSARIFFLFKNATYPSKYNPENTDPRKLGFALRGITLYGYSLKQ